jgi:glycosyltransferase involved in cell wall biosynthesis
MRSGLTAQSGGKRLKGITPENSPDLPLITVVTAVFNGAKTLEATIQSVACQTYPHLEYIIIDGGSTDGTLDIIRKYEHAIDYWLSEPDKGVYDAMNKGITASTGSWLNFLNANDVLADSSTIDYVATRYLHDNARFIYSDVLLRNKSNLTPQKYVCDHTRLIINHQASIYHKSLHDEHGLYLVAPKLTISDYFFFSLVNQLDYLKADRPIAIYDTTGMSQSQQSVQQKLIVDYLLNGMPKYKFLIYFILYFPYKSFKKYFAS